MKKCKGIIIGALVIINIGFIIFSVVTMTHAASFSVLMADDFTHANGVGVFHTSIWNYVIASFRYAKKFYMIWQGTYFSMFLQALLSPINNFGFSQLRCVMAFNVLLFYFALIFYLWSDYKWIGQGKICKAITITIIAMSVFCFCGFFTYEQIFFWYSGAISYSIPLSLLLIALGICLRITEKKNVFAIVGIVVLGIMSMGGSLTVSGLGCFLLLLICLDEYILTKRISRVKIGILGIWILFAGVNAIAPGNFARHSSMDPSGVHPLSAFMCAIDLVNSRLQIIFASTCYVALLLMVLLIGYLYNSRERMTGVFERCIVSIIGLTVPIVTAFPVALGYTYVEEMPNRCEFIVDASLYLVCFKFAFLVGAYIAEKTEFLYYKMILCFLLVQIGIVVMLDGYGISNVKINDIREELNAGIYEDYYYACKDFFYGLEEYSAGDVVVIKASDVPKEIDNIFAFQLSNDTHDWINEAIAEYYGFESMAVK